MRRRDRSRIFDVMGAGRRSRNRNRGVYIPCAPLQERILQGEDSGDESKVGWFWDEKMLRSSARKWAASRGYPEVLLEDLDETVNLVKQRQISEQEIVWGPSIDSGDVLSLIVSEWLSCCRCCTPTCSSARILPFGFT